MSIIDAGKEAGQRWMLKFEVGYFGTLQNPDQLTRKPVLRFITYDEVVNSGDGAALPAIVVKSPEIIPIVLAESTTTPSDLPSDEPPVVIRNDQRADQPLESVRQLHNVVFFNNTAYQKEVDLSTQEPSAQPQGDLRFRAILRSISVNGSSSLPFQDEAKKSAWVESNKDNIVLLKPDLRDPDKNSPDILVTRGNIAADNIRPVVLLTNSHILPFFFLEQSVGFFLVAELIEDAHSTVRRLLVSIFVHDGKDSPTGRQMYLITPPYDMVNVGKLYSVGFHQDTNGDTSRLEFTLGREDTFRQFATYDLKDTDHIYFKTAKDSGSSKVGIGCWPSWPEEGSTLTYHGYIKEIICDPYSNCTTC